MTNHHAACPDCGEDYVNVHRCPTLEGSRSAPCSDRSKDDLEKTEELFEFLQGRALDGYEIPKAEMPRLTPDQAWTAIWYLGNQYWQVTDKIERCCVCGTLYDTWQSGTCIGEGEPPYHFCDNCIYTEDYERKKSNQNREFGDPTKGSP